MGLVFNPFTKRPDFVGSGSGSGSSSGNVGGITVGAEGDYITDGVADHEQIQTAFNEGASSGVPVFLFPQTYNTTSTISIPSNLTVIGAGIDLTVIKMAQGLNLTVFQNEDTTNGNEKIFLSGLTIDHNPNGNTSGGGASFIGLRDSVFESIAFNPSYNFNLYIGSVPGTSLTGTCTFTTGSPVVTGSGTSFSSDVSVNDVLKTESGFFARVAAVNSDTVLTLSIKWGHATESAITASVLPSNSNNRISNCIFRGSQNKDNVGIGLLDDSIVENIWTFDSGAGYGMGPDNCHRSQFKNIISYNNNNSGVGAETCARCIFDNITSYGNSNGMTMLSGCYRNIVSNSHLYSNTNGLQVNYNSTLYGVAEGNQFVNILAEKNSTHGIRAGGIKDSKFVGCTTINNGSYGIVLTTDNLKTPDDNIITGHTSYDSQVSLSQDWGIGVLSGNRNIVTSCNSQNSRHNNDGIRDLGTSTITANNIT